MSLALYIHVPVCRSKCSYCDFVSRVLREGEQPAIRAALEFQLAHMASFELLEEVSSVYIGGGTPSVLGEDLFELARAVRRYSTCIQNAEFTVELNPDSVDPELASSLVRLGVNRFSMGVQSFIDDELVVLGRAHDSVQAFDVARMLVGTGAKVSVDLMCGIPQQTLESLEVSVRTAIASGVGHVSLYPLMLEDETPLTLLIESQSISVAGDDEVADLMSAAGDLLGRHGLERYEVASYALLGQQSAHNTAYWTGVPYLGIGPGAASMLPVDVFSQIAEVEGWVRAGAVAPVPEDCVRVRFAWREDIDHFLRNPLAAPVQVEYLDRRERLLEDVMLGMRRTAGVGVALIKAAVEVEHTLSATIDSIVDDGLAVWWSGDGGVVSDINNAEQLRPTDTGWLLGNELFGRIWSSG